MHLHISDTMQSLIRQSNGIATAAVIAVREFAHFAVFQLKWGDDLPNVVFCYIHFCCLLNWSNRTPPLYDNVRL